MKLLIIITISKCDDMHKKEKTYHYKTNTLFMPIMIVLPIQFTFFIFLRF